MSYLKLKCILICSFLFASFFVYAQEAPSYRRNAVYVEAGGTGVIGSINYERLKRLKNGNYFAPSVGIAIPFPENSENASSEIYMIPLQFNWLLGQKASKFELGFSVNPIYMNSVITEAETSTEEKGVGVLPSFRAGYRYMGSKGLVIRAGFTPVVFINPWVGISLGYSF